MRGILRYEVTGAGGIYRSIWSYRYVPLYGDTVPVYRTGIPPEDCLHYSIKNLTISLKQVTNNLAA